MTPWQAAVLAVVQAVTEFLPVSSSGHLILLPHLLGWTDQGLEFDIATNSGTLLAVMAYFRADIARMAGSFFASFRAAERAVNPDARMVWLLAWATIPAGLAGLLVKGWISSYGRDPRLIAATAIGYGALLLYADRRSSRLGAGRALEEFGMRAAMLVGCAQALALVPGTSRSGITITAALLLGFARPAAARFSFLLAIPIGLLLAAKQIFDVARGLPIGVPPGALVIGIAVSALAGYAVIAFLLGWVRQRSLAPFAWYRLALGVVLLVVFWR
ncbi:MAG: undecaprenyl-diphosphate phosphatase [Thermoanaerobaculia bacterium]|jgi:undecaprenyl-diphosphatase|nr:undecaprenyl-diphosphate phosphatase [Thermoanaerobaculia bacterium]MBP9823125.1 undecaprenyl-diphosphate phosphatase [Thermoanaerobaculia bacterium]